MKREWSHRHPGPELMDAEGIPDPDLFRNYRELQFINRWLGGYSITRKGIRLLEKQAVIQTVLDIGCGGGDQLKFLWKHFENRRQVVSLAGIDRSHAAITYAKKNGHSLPGIQWIHDDVFAYLEHAPDYDVLTATLFMHHFSNEEIARLLTLMVARSRAGVVINDLHRNAVAFRSIQALSYLFSSSYLVKHDAPLSVLRGFTRKEWLCLTKEGGVSVHTLKWQWAFRHLLIVQKMKS